MPTKHAHRRCALSCHSFYTNWESGFEQGGLLLPTYETLVARKQVLRCRAPWSACSVCKPVKACARVPAARLLEGGGPKKESYLACTAPTLSTLAGTRERAG